MTHPTNNNSVWGQLESAGIVTGEPPANNTTSSPWFVKILMAFCGWLAACFILGFLLLAFSGLTGAPVGLLTLGTVVVAVAFLLLRNQNNLFTQNLGFAFSLAGQVLIVGGLFQLLPDTEFAPGIAVFVLQLALCLLMPSYIHRVASTFFACGALFFAVSNYAVMPYIFGLLLLLSALLWLHEFSFPKEIHRLHPIGYGLVIAVIALSAMRVFGGNHFQSGISLSGTDFNLNTLNARIITQVVIGLSAALVVFKVLARNKQSALGLVSLLSFTGVALLCALSTFAPGITIGATILFLGYANSNRVLMALGVLCLIFYTSCYYYQLDTTLLVKAQTLLAIGVALLACRFIMQLALPKDSTHA